MMSLPGVVGTAATLRDNETCILVMVAKWSVELAELLPDTIDGYAVQVQETGEISAFGETTN
jgi:hypothetical protein